MAISAIQHPFAGIVVDQPRILEGLDFSQRKLNAQSVPAHLASEPPYQQTAGEAHPTAEPTLPDPITIARRGSETSLASHLTIGLFETCLKRLKNNKAAGSDMWPNELLKHLPGAYRSMLFAFFGLCWATCRTPDTWKGSTTLLFHKKGPTTDPANYRPIALHSNIYKLWTRLVHSIIATYAERVGMISDSQEGFQAHHSTGRQAEHFVSTCEDARLCKQDLFALKLDFASAFNRVDHARLFYIMEQLGIPADAIAVVKGIYSGARTCVQTSSGDTAAIPISRGTIQGDSLSPFLFIIFLEPLLRWLRAGGRGYRYGCMPQGLQECASADAFADDLLLLTGCPTQMQQQIRKVEAFCDWTGMTLNPQKSELSAILHGATGQPGSKHNACDWDLISPILSKITVNGQQVKLIPPNMPLQCLGLFTTLSLDWKYQYAAAEALILTKGEQILQSSATMQQKWEMEEGVIFAALRYSFCVAPYNPAQLKKLDSLRATVIKAILGLPKSTSTDLLFLPTDKLGLQFRSLIPAYVEVAAQSLVTSMEDKGRLGTLEGSHEHSVYATSPP
jgi:hypothetical protein